MFQLGKKRAVLLLLTVRGYTFASDSGKLAAGMEVGVECDQSKSMVECRKRSRLSGDLRNLLRHLLVGVEVAAPGAPFGTEVEELVEVAAVT